MKTLLFPIIFILFFGMMSCSEKTTEPFANTVATPTFSLESGTYLAQTQYEISCSTPDVTIRYTTDGTVPNKHSLIYTVPLIIETSTLVKAVAFKKGWNQSAAATAFYEVYHGVVGDIYISRILATPDTIFADNGASYSSIKVTVKDENAFGVSEQLVNFTTDMGIIVSAATTNEFGIATTIFKAENETGIATITAIVRRYDPEHPNLLVSADTASVQIYINEAPPVVPTVHSMRFHQQGNIDLNVINTGGTEQALLRVKLYDELGSLVLTPQSVWFKIVSSNPPLGANLNNQPQGDSVLVTSVSGEAQVFIYSGTAQGNLEVKASCTSGGIYNSINKSNIFIHPGPPNRIDVQAGGYNSGVIMGGGLWRIIVSAIVKDIYGNPSDYGTSVWFYLPDDTHNCTIGANSYIGMESANGDSTAGVAYTTLVYSGVYTNESLKIRAVTGGINGQEVVGEALIILPLNQPQLELEIVPGHLVFHGNENTVPASATALLNATVFDVQGCYIHTVRINLTSTRGVFEPIHGTNRDPQNCNPYAQPNVIVTDGYDPIAIYDHYYDSYWQIPGGPDVADDPSGAQGQIRFYAWEVPLGDPMVGNPGLTSVTISGQIPGTNVSAGTSIILIRYPESPD